MVFNTLALSFSIVRPRTFLRKAITVDGNFIEASADVGFIPIAAGQIPFLLVIDNFNRVIKATILKNTKAEEIRRGFLRLFGKDKFPFQVRVWKNFHL